MENTNSNPYNYYSTYYGNYPNQYAQLNRRDEKAINKAAEHSFSYPYQTAQPLGTYSKPRVTRWVNPISVQEISAFNQTYQDFIDAAKQYRANQLGNGLENNDTTRVASIQQQASEVPKQQIEGRKVYEILGQAPPSTTGVNYQQPMNPYGQPMGRSMSAAQASNLYSNLNLNNLLSKPAPVQTPKNTLEDYISRAFSKCITVSERMFMSKALQSLTAVGDPSIDWSTRPLPLLPREKVFDQAKVIDENISKKQQRLERFNKEKSSDLLHSMPIAKESKQVKKVIGTCTDLEKPYFRLGSDPDPAKVRPEHVLKKTLKLLKGKWKNKEHEYRYFEDQFKSLRQDLLVQGIKTKFCVKVYETHARIALESADLDHFNQCQTQLAELYHLGFKGHENEFLCYKLLYYVLNDMKFEIGTFLADLTEEQKQDKDIKFGLQMRRAYSVDNYHKFFKYYKSAPNMIPYLVDVFIDKLRLKFLRIIAKSYIAGISCDHIKKSLAFESKSEMKEFFVKVGAILSPDKKTLNSKESFPILMKANVKIKHKPE